MVVASEGYLRILSIEAGEAGWGELTLATEDTTAPEPVQEYAPVVAWASRSTGITKSIYREACTSHAAYLSS